MLLNTFHIFGGIIVPQKNLNLLAQDCCQWWGVMDGLFCSKVSDYLLGFLDFSETGCYTGGEVTVIPNETHYGCVMQMQLCSHVSAAWTAAGSGHSPQGSRGRRSWRWCFLLSLTETHWVLIPRSVTSCLGMILLNAELKPRNSIHMWLFFSSTCVKLRRRASSVEWFGL